MAKRRANKANNNRQGLATTSTVKTNRASGGRMVRGVRMASANNSNAVNAAIIDQIQCPDSGTSGTSSDPADLVPSIPGIDLVDKNLQQLRQMITLSFEKNPIESNNSNSDEQQQPVSTKLVDCRKFYELVYQLIKYQNATDLVYDAYRNCAVDCFRKFAKNLTTSLHSSTNLSNEVGPNSILITQMPTLVDCNVSLIKYWKTIFDTILPNIGFAFVYPERLLLKSSNLMLIYELTCHHFATEIVCVDPVRGSIVALYQHYIDGLRDRFKRHLLDQLSTRGDCHRRPMKQADIEQIVRSAYEWSNRESPSTIMKTDDLLQPTSADESDCFPIVLCSNLTKMLFELDNENLSIFYRIVELPLIRQTVQYTKELSEELIVTNQLSMLDYVVLLDSLIKLNCRLFESIGFPKQSIQNMESILVHFLLTNRMNEIVFLNRTSFQSLFQKAQLVEGDESLIEATELYQQVIKIQNHNNNNDYSSITELPEKRHEPTVQQLEQFLLFIDEHLRSVFMNFAKQFDFKKRSDSLEFVRAMVQTMNNLDFICKQVFQWNRTIDSKITTFYGQLLAFNDRIPQALGYYMHDICMKGSTVLPNEPSMQLLIGRLSAAEVNREEAIRCDALSKLMGPYYRLIPYLRDHNDLFDYSKHYFCQRLLLPEAVEYSVSKQMIMFDELCGHIKALFSARNGEPGITKENCFFSNAETVARIQRNDTKPNYYQFSQNLQDFHTIQNDFQNSENFFANFFVKQSAAAAVAAADCDVPVTTVDLDQCKILHAGIWKMVDFDQCRIPKAVYASWKEFAVYYANHIGMKKLLLNTKHCNALVEMKLGKEQFSSRTIQLLVSMHQLSIIWCFESQNSRTYEQLKQLTKFQKEANLQLALLSLVYSGLLLVRNVSRKSQQPKRTSTTSSIVYQESFNDLQFELNEEYRCGELALEPYDISINEYLNFWKFSPKDEDVEKSKTDEANNSYQGESIRKLIDRICSQKDLMFENSSESVQDVNQIQRILSSNSGGSKKLFPTHGPSNGLGLRSKRTDTTRIAKNSDRSASSRSSGVSSTDILSQCNKCGNDIGSSSSSTAATAGVTRTNSNEIDINSVDNLIKVECAIVRLLKRGKQPSVLAINRKLKEMLHNKPGYSVEWIELISYDLTTKIVQGLVDKKYVRLEPDGQYCFIIN